MVDRHFHMLLITYYMGLQQVISICLMLCAGGLLSTGSQGSPAAGSAGQTENQTKQTGARPKQKKVSVTFMLSDILILKP